MRYVFTIYDERTNGKDRFTVAHKDGKVLFQADHSSRADAALLLVYRVYIKIKGDNLKLPSNLPSDATEAQRFLFPMLVRQRAALAQPNELQRTRTRALFWSTFS